MTRLADRALRLVVAAGLTSAVFASVTALAQDARPAAPAQAAATIDFLESEFSFASVRWLRLDISRVVTRGTWVEKPDLGNVEEVGFANLTQGTGHGWGGFVNVGKIEVYGKPVVRK